MDNDVSHAWLRSLIETAVGPGIVRILLVGSRAKGTAKEGSDWDVLVIDQGTKSIWPIGPWRQDDKLMAPDGNPIEYFKMPPSDLADPRAAKDRFIQDALKYGIDI
ncbi:MAG: hypothetical protein DI589_26015 [Shinella sp.]|nr:MAG: hypothetical protein DI589_26015 [Shinella sp.]